MPLQCGVYNEAYSKDLVLLRTKRHWGLIIGFVALIMTLPLYANPSLISWLTLVAITVLSALGLNVITGYCGQLSIGHAAFMAVGAFTYANLTRIGVMWPLAIICSGVSGGLIGTIFGLPSIRIKELYLALTTLAAQFIVPWVIVEYFGGGFGVVPPVANIGRFLLRGVNHFYYLSWAVTLLTSFFVYNLSRTKIGRAYKAIRDHDLAAKAMGINIGFYKVSSFTIGCFIAGVAGALWAIWVGKADIEHFHILESIWYLAMLMTGGMGSIVGVYFGVVLIRGLTEGGVLFANWLIIAFSGYIPEHITASIPTMIVSAVIILFIIIEPRGMNHRWLMFKESYRLWPWSYW